MLRAYHPNKATYAKYGGALDDGVRVLRPAILYGDRTELDSTLDHFVGEGLLPGKLREGIIYTPVDKIEIPLGMPNGVEGSVRVDLPHVGVPLSVEIAAGPGGSYLDQLIENLLAPESRKRGALYAITLDHVKWGLIPESVVDALRAYDWDMVHSHVRNLEIQRAKVIMQSNEASQPMHQKGLIQKLWDWMREE